VLAAALAAPAPAPATIRARDGGMPYYRNVFPVQGPHGVRGAVGIYHAPRNGGRIHEGFDITAACGTELVAAATGKVTGVGYDPVLYGNYLQIHGQGERRSYFYAHLLRPPLVDKGERVWAGERVGAVGQTGNAISTPCHLHFELHVRGRPVNPEAELRRWDRYS
jgi:murein DD-endopeptidase MepM/ murein hydrolase activator NlpD